MRTHQDPFTWLPPEADVTQMMTTTGMGRIQAINHLRGRAIARRHAEALQRERYAACLASLSRATTPETTP